MRILSTVAVGVAVIGLSACSSSTETTSASPAASASASASASESPMPMISDPVLPPVMVDQAGSVDAWVGQYIVLDSPEVAEVKTTSPKVLEVSQPGKEGGAVMNGGAKVIASGFGNLTAYDADGKELFKVDVVATEPKK